MENSIEFPQNLKKKKRTSILSGNPNSGYLSEENKNTKITRYMHSMSIAALFTIVKIWKSFKCPLIYKWRKTLWYIYVYVHTHIICRDIHIYMEYYSAIKIVKCCNLQQHG